MRHKPGTITFSQGWLGNQLEEAAKEQMSEEAQMMGEQILAQWKVIDEALDELLEERKALRATVNSTRAAMGMAPLPE
jgi:hypothetical protein